MEKYSKEEIIEDKEIYNCPVCNDKFRRSIQKWMIFKCKQCGKDMCKLDDLNLYSGLCDVCTTEKFKKMFPQKIKTQEEIKEKEIQNNKEIIDIVKDKNNNVYVEKNLGKWFK